MLEANELRYSEIFIKHKACVEAGGELLFRQRLNAIAAVYLDRQLVQHNHAGSQGC